MYGYQNPLSQIEARIDFLNEVIRTTYNQNEAAQARGELNQLLAERDRILASMNGVGTTYGQQPPPVYGIRRDTYQRPMYPSSVNAYPNSRPASTGFLQRDVNPGRAPSTTVNVQSRYSSKMANYNPPKDNGYNSYNNYQPVPAEKPDIAVIVPQIIADLETEMVNRPLGFKKFTFKVDKEFKSLEDVFAKKCPDELNVYLTDTINNLLVNKFKSSVAIESYKDDIADLVTEIKKNESGGEMKASYLQRDLVDEINAIKVVDGVVTFTEPVLYVTTKTYKELAKRFALAGKESTPVTYEELKNKFDGYLSNDLDKSLFKRALIITIGVLPKYFIITKNIETGEYVVSLP